MGYQVLDHASDRIEGGKFSVLVEVVHDDGGLTSINLSHLEPPYVFGDIYHFPLRIVRRNVAGDYLGERVIQTEAEMEEDPALMAAELNAELRRFDDMEAMAVRISSSRFGRWPPSTASRPIPTRRRCAPTWSGLGRHWHSTRSSAGIETSGA